MVTMPSPPPCPLRARWPGPGPSQLLRRAAAQRVRDGMLPLITAMQVRHGGAGSRVAHAVHQLSQVGALISSKLVTGVPQVVKVNRWIASFRSPANQAAQVSLVSGDATAHEDSVLSADVDDVDAAYALAQATELLPDYDKCQAYIADVHSAFRSGR